MKIIVIYIFRFFLNIIYFFLKMLPTNNNKVVFISRQSDEINIDFKLLKEEIEKRNKEIKMMFLCNRMKNGLMNNIKYFFVILKQMFYLATSKIVVLDSYCIPVSILKHKKSLFILQIWHSIGKIKMSGYQTLDAKSGRSKKVAKAMCMHKNYDAIVAGAPVFDKFYEAGFNTTRDKLLHFGLPRIDYLINNEEKVKNKIYNKYPELKNRKIVLYAPTFRTYKVDGPEKMIEKYNKTDFVLIARGHTNQDLNIDNNKVYNLKEYKTADVLTIADYVITDYSSIALEAAILNKKLLFYVYDYDKYMKENGLNIDFYKVLPTCSSKDIEDLFKIIKTDKYDDESYQKFRKKYLPKNIGKSTKKIVDFIIKEIEK